MESAEPQELPPASPEVRQYQGLKVQALAFGTLLSLAILTFWAVVLGPRWSGWLPDGWGESRWLQLIAAGLLLAITLEAVSLPVDFWSGYVVEHRFGLSRQTLGRWLVRRLKGYLVGGVLGLALVSGLYAAIWFTGVYWWLWATAGWLLVSLVLGQLLPVVILPLFYRVTPLADGGLTARLRNLTEGTGLTLEGVYRLELSKETRKANAALAGLGRTRRVLLGDTLLEQFTPEEIEVVFAHEVGHHVFHHLPKSIGLRVVLALAGFWLVDWLLQQWAPALGYGHFAEPAALPLVLLVLTGFGLLLTPLQNAISRRFERQCDRYALERTGNPLAYRSAFVKLATINKANPDPARLVVWLLYDHPPIRERLAAGKAG